MLCLAAEQPTYGYDLARLLAPQGSIGRIWHVPKTEIYRSLRRLESLGLIQTVVQEPSTLGPARSRCEVTAAGQAAARDWLNRPVAHGRDVRSELLAKLALLRRTGTDPADLLRAQLAVFARSRQHWRLRSCPPVGSSTS